MVPKKFKIKNIVPKFNKQKNNQNNTIKLEINPKNY